MYLCISVFVSLLTGLDWLKKIITRFWWVTSQILHLLLYQAHLLPLPDHRLEGGVVHPVPGDLGQAAVRPGHLLVVLQLVRPGD